MQPVKEIQTLSICDNYLDNEYNSEINSLKASISKINADISKYQTKILNFEKSQAARLEAISTSQKSCVMPTPKPKPEVPKRTSKEFLVQSHYKTSKFLLLHENYLIFQQSRGKKFGLVIYKPFDLMDKNYPKFIHFFEVLDKGVSVTHLSNFNHKLMIILSNNFIYILEKLDKASLKKILIPTDLVMTGPPNR